MIKSYGGVAWNVEYANEFGVWWDGLSEAEQDSVDRVVGLLIERGVNLARPFSDTVYGSRFTNM